MFNGFQQTGQSILTFSPNNLTYGFPANAFSANTLPIVTTGIAAWWTAQSGVSLSGSNVTSWVDLIGGYNMQPTTAAPTYNTANTAVRSYPSLGFTSTQNLSAGNILNIGTNAGFTVVAVVNLTSAYVFLSKSTAISDTTAGCWSLQNYQSNVYFTYGRGGGYTQIATPSTTGVAVITAIVDRIKGLVWCYVNYASTSGAITATLSNVTPAAPLTINGVIGGGYSPVIMDVIMYNKALTRDQVNQNVTYFKSKYGF